MPEIELNEPETQEELDNVAVNLADFTRGDGQLVSYGKQELGLLQKLASTGEEKYKDEQWWRMCSFKDESEAYDHVAAYREAVDIGMDEKWNVAYAFSLCSTNRRGGFLNNLTAVLTDTLQHAKWANQSRQKNDEYNRSPRSPLARQ